MVVNTETFLVGEVDIVDISHDHDPIRRFETVELPVRQYVKLAQIRGERNPVTSELKSSIMAEGLLYEPISARISGELLEEYMAFVNKLWGSNASIEQFAGYRQDGGEYYLIVAGHSRHQAFEELVDEGRLPLDQTLPTKVATVESVWDIIELQRADNIHSAPPKERNAMATIEAYEWGRSKGLWRNTSEFAAHSKKNGKKISVSVLREMKHFAKLPGEIRTFVLGGSIPYSVGIEMGKGVGEIRRYYALEAGYPSYDPDRMGSKDKEQIDMLVARALNIDCIRIAQSRQESRKFTILAAKNIVKGSVLNYQQRADRLSLPSDDTKEYEYMLFELKDPLERMLTDADKAVRQGLRNLATANNGSTVAFVRQHMGHVSDGEIAAIARALEAQAEEARLLREAATARHVREFTGTRATAELVAVS